MENLNLDLNKGKKTYLYVDLSETDNDNLISLHKVKMIITHIL